MTICFRALALPGFLFSRLLSGFRLSPRTGRADELNRIEQLLGLCN
jgi:hypothetical protein